ncbi:MAG: hypothetical protein KBG15_09700 [Kofleriaceae bacterium]|nr:hypothetical protein [Kofleriaceae bacterium]
MAKHGQLQYLAEAIARAAVASDEVFRGVVREVAEYAGVPAAGVKVEQGNQMQQIWHGLPVKFERDFAAKFWRDDPWTNASRGLAAGRFMLSVNVIPNPALEKLAFYQDLCVPHGLRDAMGACLFRNDHNYVTFGLMRPQKAKGNGEREAARVRPLVSHLTSAMRVRLALQARQAAPISARVPMNGLPFAALLVDKSGRVVELNDRADALLREGQLLALRHGGLAVAAALEHRRFLAALAQATLALDPQSATVAIAVRQRSAWLIITPAGRSTQHPCAFVHVLEEQPCAVPSAQALRSMFGLTPAETLVAIAIAQGQTPTEIAAQHTLALSTVRSQLSAVLRKTRTSRQADLVRLFTRLTMAGVASD